MPSRTDPIIPDPPGASKVASRGEGGIEPLSAVGLRIRQLRRARRITLEALSRASGLSKSFLSDIERGRSDITLTSLQRIAQALGVPLAYFFRIEEDDLAGPKIVRAHQRHAFRMASAAHTLYSNLTATWPDKELEVVLVTLLPNRRHRVTPYDHPGEEFGFILEGTLTVIYGDREYTLNPGDSIHMRSSVPHNWENRTDRPVQALWVVTPPIFKAPSDPGIPDPRPCSDATHCTDQTPCSDPTKEGASREEDPR
ncbi:Cupin 2 conserved barrel domain protein [Thermaerobacter marianensis DSM 12885]|uniref:Cupin 2 conserved barrel domain protein n=1 Tax=Thermaerobacter marianensis (strain ATCC 700841 / DSM 12885 / JCM 10246 / 7p75a) TaxID=644966 RepID=E6SGS3_THEM7|nr:Cupin 2 conserved barrel domain protein [Thermaerobacter marianensis DSM 12885]